MTTYRTQYMYADAMNKRAVKGVRFRIAVGFIGRKVPGVALWLAYARDARTNSICQFLFLLVVVVTRGRSSSSSVFQELSPFFGSNYTLQRTIFLRPVHESRCSSQSL